MTPRLIPTLVAWGAVLWTTISASATAPSLEPLPGYSGGAEFRGDASLHAVAFADRRTGVAVGDRGTILRTLDGGTSWQIRPTGVDCRLDDAIWLDASHVVAVGGSYDRVTGLSRGVVLTSDDGGRRWRVVDDAPLPRLRRVRLKSDGRTLVAIGDWSPVTHTRGFESRDRGRSWEGRELTREVAALSAEPDAATRRAWTETAGSPAPIRGRCRVGRSHLWAVGDHGVIVHSPDGGRSWSVRRGRRRQTAILVVARGARTTPWPLIGKETLEHGHRVAVLTAERDRPSVATGSSVDLMRRATVMLAGAAADRLSTPESGNGAADMTATAVPDAAARGFDDWLAMHRPKVLVLDAAFPPPTLRRLTDIASRRGVSRIMSYAIGGDRPGGRGESTLHSRGLLSRTGVLARDLWEDALHRVAPGADVAETISLTRLYDATGASSDGGSVTTGVGLSSGHRLQARLAPASGRQLQVARGRLAESQWLDRLFGTSGEFRARGDSRSFRSSLETLVERNAREDRFRLLWSVFRRVHRDGRVGDEPVVLEEIAARFGGTSVGAWATLRRDAINSSAEWDRLRSSVSGDDSEGGSPAVATAEAVPVSPFQNDDELSAGSKGVVQASAAVPLLVPRAESIELSGGRRSQRRGENENVDVDLLWEFHPAALLARDAVKRRQAAESLQPTGDKLSGDLARLGQARDAGGWPRLIAAGDSAVRAVSAATRPRLDDSLGDSCWQAAPASVMPPSASAPASYRPGGDRGASSPTAAEHLPDDAPLKVRLAYDDDYLYLAVDAPADRLPPTESNEAKPTGARDEALADADRLSVRIDTDRDLMTAFQLQVSPGGRTRDSIDGHTDWQPTWYVSPSRSEHRVRFELAILRRDLAELPIAAGSRWHLSVRILPAGEPSTTTIIPDAEQWLPVDFQ